MKQNLVYLTYTQAMILVLRFKKMREENPYFKNGLMSQYEEYVLIRTIELSRMSKLEYIKESFPKPYGISKSLYEFLKRLSGIDVLDLKCYLKYKKEVEDYESKIAGNFTRKYIKE